MANETRKLLTQMRMEYGHTHDTPGGARQNFKGVSKPWRSSYNAARHTPRYYGGEGPIREEYVIEHEAPDIHLEPNQVAYTLPDDPIQVFVATKSRVAYLRETGVEIEVHNTWPRMEEAANNQGLYGFRILAA